MRSVKSWVFALASLSGLLLGLGTITAEEGQGVATVGLHPASQFGGTHVYALLPSADGSRPENLEGAVDSALVGGVCDYQVFADAYADNTVNMCFSFSQSLGAVLSKPGLRQRKSIAYHTVFRAAVLGLHRLQSLRRRGVQRYDPRKPRLWNGLDVNSLFGASD